MSDNPLKDAAASGLYHLPPARLAMVESAASRARFCLMKADIAEQASVESVLFQLGSALNLQPGSTTRMEVSRGPNTNDVAQVLGALSYGGTLIVTNAGGPLAAGDAFTLFSAASRSGAFAATNLPPLGPGLGWNFNSTSGVLSVIQTVATYPTNLVALMTGNTVSLSWPSEHTGWSLQSNAVSLVARDAWLTVP